MLVEETITVFDESNGKLVMNMLKYISENYDAGERTYNDKDGNEIVSSYRLLMVAQNSSVIDSWVVLNSLVKELTELKTVKTAGGLITLSFRCAVRIVKTCEVPKYVKFTCSKSQTKDSLEKFCREYPLQLELLKAEIEHSVIIKSEFADLRHICEPYLKLDLLCLAFIYAKHSTEMQKKSGFGIKDCSTEASLGWKCFKTYNKNQEI